MHIKPNDTFDINCHWDSITDVLANSYFIVQIYHAKSFKKTLVQTQPWQQNVPNWRDYLWLEIQHKQDFLHLNNPNPLIIK